MEQLANQGDGVYAYIDTVDEAERVFVRNLTSMLLTIARDAKVQVVFNPAVVARYRLLGYENRHVADEDFRNDAVDAGEIGAGHSVTALYEVKFHEDAAPSEAAMTVYVRYADPQVDEVIELSQSMSRADFVERFEETTPTFQLSAVVAEYAEILRDSYWAQGNSVAALLAEVERVAAYFPANADVREFQDLVSRAAVLNR